MTPCVSPAAFLRFLKESNTIYGPPPVSTSEIPQTVKSHVLPESLLLISFTPQPLLSFQTESLVFHGKELCFYHCSFFFTCMRIWWSIFKFFLPFCFRLLVFFFFLIFIYVCTKDQSACYCLIARKYKFSSCESPNKGLIQYSSAMRVNCQVLVELITRALLSAFIRTSRHDWSMVNIHHFIPDVDLKSSILFEECERTLYAFIPAVTWEGATATLPAGQLRRSKARWYIRHSSSRDQATFSITHIILVIKFHSIPHEHSVPLIYAQLL